MERSTLHEALLPVPDGTDGEGGLVPAIAFSPAREVLGSLGHSFVSARVDEVMTLPVTRHGRLVGMVFSLDVLRWLTEQVGYMRTALDRRPRQVLSGACGVGRALPPAGAEPL